MYGKGRWRRSIRKIRNGRKQVTLCRILTYCVAMVKNWAEDTGMGRAGGGDLQWHLPPHSPPGSMVRLTGLAHWVPLLASQFQLYPLTSAAMCSGQEDDISPTEDSFLIKNTWISVFPTKTSKQTLRKLEMESTGAKIVTPFCFGAGIKPRAL